MDDRQNRSNDPRSRQPQRNQQPDEGRRNERVERRDQPEDESEE